MYCLMERGNPARAVEASRQQGSRRRGRTPGLVVPVSAATDQTDNVVSMGMDDDGRCTPTTAPWPGPGYHGPSRYHLKVPRGETDERFAPPISFGVPLPAAAVGVCMPLGPTAKPKRDKSPQRTASQPRNGGIEGDGWIE